MGTLVVRRLLVDLATPFPARWNGGDAFRSAFMSALSMSFPVGEQYFIDSVREGVKTLPAETQARFADEVRGFIGQEATHRRIHSLFNSQLEKLGYTNEIERRTLRRLKASAHRDIRIHVAATAATEHFTATFADWLLRHPEALAGTESRLQLMWQWHSAEESEHRNTAFDVYQAMGGSHAWRLRLYRYITVVFLTDLMRQTVRNLWHDRALFKWRTWKSCYAMLFAKDGMLRGNVQMWRDYCAPDFHPSQHDASLSVKWLAEQSAHFSIVGQAA